MRRALQEARAALTSGEVPVGAVAVLDDEPIICAGNAPRGQKDPTAHAEIIVLRKAARYAGNYRLPNLSIYVTLEPCAMCYGAMIHARIARLIFGADDPKSGVLGGAASLEEYAAFNHRIAVSGGILADECSALLKTFFAARR